MVTVMVRETGEVVTEVPVGVEPEGVAVSADSRVTVVTSESTSMAHFIDNESLEVVANVLVDTRPRHAEFHPDQKTVWVTSEIGGTVSVIDTASHEILTRIGFSVPGLRQETIQPVGLRFSLDGRWAFVALGPANRVAVIDAATFEVKDYILVGQRPWHIEIGPDGKKLFVANGLTNDMTVIDVASLTAEKSVPSAVYPWGIRHQAVKPPAARVGQKWLGVFEQFPGRRKLVSPIGLRRHRDGWQRISEGRIGRLPGQPQMGRPSVVQLND